MISWPALRAQQTGKIPFPLINAFRSWLAGAVATPTQGVSPEALASAATQSNAACGGRRGAVSSRLAAAAFLFYPAKQAHDFGTKSSEYTLLVKCLSETVFSGGAAG